ncbi:hypothetical protein FGB62_59g020 [Gracilaria domingensis]|nr:hypothetical protein FGB62_59g020 [Gracilaria domingensis]
MNGSTCAFGLPPISIASQLVLNVRRTSTAAFAAIALAVNKSHKSVSWQVHKAPQAIESCVTRTTRRRHMCVCTAPVVVFDKDCEMGVFSTWHSSESEQAPERQAEQKVQEGRALKPLRAHNVLQRGSSLSSTRNLVSELRILARLLVALVVGGVIGMERRAANSLAGVRTFSLVSVGAALFMSTALIAFPNSDPARVAAAISSSVGFLGAGAMHKNAKHSRGLTTACSVWLAAALGIAAASGMFLLSFTGAISTVLIARYARFDSSLQLIRGDPTVVCSHGAEEEEEEGEEGEEGGDDDGDEARGNGRVRYYDALEADGSAEVDSWLQRGREGDSGRDEAGDGGGWKGTRDE